MYDGCAWLASTDGRVHALALMSGAVRHRIGACARMVAPPWLVDGRILVGTTAGRLLEIDPAAGRVTGAAQFATRSQIR